MSLERPSHGEGRLASLIFEENGTGRNSTHQGLG